MCAQYIVDKTGKELARLFKALLRKASEPRGRILPHRPAPVVLREGDDRVLTDMEFSLLPAWSKDRRVKFATHNARLFSEDPKTHRATAIFEKPTWREPFARRHCLVPMTQFIEPLYTGPLAGNMVGFLPRTGGVFAAAGLWDEWVSKESGEVVRSFAVITDDPVPHIAQMGHDRTPVFLGEVHFDRWLNASASSPGEWVEFLRENRETIDWTEAVDRPLAAGWERKLKD